MISRQIGATLGGRQRAGVGGLQRIDHGRLALGTKRGEPSARFSSPIVVATAARRLSRPSSSRSIASICARSDSRSAGGVRGCHAASYLLAGRAAGVGGGAAPLQAERRG
jgi:hypothetical protein